MGFHVAQPRFFDPKKIFSSKKFFTLHMILPQKELPKVIFSGDGHP